MVKYLTLTFSDKQRIPNENENVEATGGFRHNQFEYLARLPFIAFFIDRIAVFPPPFLCLEARHNNNKRVDKKRQWDDFFNVEKISNTEFDPPFNFSKEGLVESKNLSIQYYDSDCDLSQIDPNIDIAVLSNYNKENRFSYSALPLPKMNKKCDLSLVFEASQLITDVVNDLLKNIKQPFTFIHIRRTDYLDNKVLAPPHGTRPYTSPDYIAKFIINCDKFSKNDNIVISTDEKDPNYKNELKQLLSKKNIYFEENLIEMISKTILLDNYLIYQIMHEIASRCSLNIGTCGYCRLGKGCHLKLSNNICIK